MPKLYRWLVPAILLNLVIFMHSFMNAFISGAESGSVVRLVSDILDYVGIDISLNLLSFIIRKMAHFGFFLLLAILWYKSFEHLNMKPVIYFTLIHGLMSAITDETIQGFTVGRSKELRDVFIDFTGVLVGLLVMYVYETFKKKTTR